MDERKRELLAGAGIDVQDAMERFMQRDDLLERFMKKFLENAAFEDLKQAAAEGDCGKMLAALPFSEGNVRQPVHDGADRSVYRPGGPAAFGGFFGSERDDG